MSKFKVGLLALSFVSVCSLQVSAVPFSFLRGAVCAVKNSALKFIKAVPVMPFKDKVASMRGHLVSRFPIFRKKASSGAQVPSFGFLSSMAKVDEFNKQSPVELQRLSDSLKNEALNNTAEKIESLSEKMGQRGLKFQRLSEDMRNTADRVREAALKLDSSSVYDEFVEIAE